MPSDLARATRAKHCDQPRHPPAAANRSCAAYLTSDVHWCQAFILPGGVLIWAQTCLADQGVVCLFPLVLLALIGVFALIRLVPHDLPARDWKGEQRYDFLPINDTGDTFLGNNKRGYPEFRMMNSFGLSISIGNTSHNPNSSNATKVHLCTAIHCFGIGCNFTTWKENATISVFTIPLSTTTSSPHLKLGRIYSSIVGQVYLHIRGGFESRRSTEIFYFENHFKIYAGIVWRSSREDLKYWLFRKLHRSRKANPRTLLFCPLPFNKFVSFACLRQLSLGGVGLSLNLPERSTSQAYEYNGGQNRSNLQNILNQSPDSRGWFFLIVGAAIFSYFYWQAKSGMYRWWWLWLLFAACGLILFGYGFSLFLDSEETRADRLTQYAQLSQDALGNQNELRGSVHGLIGGMAHIYQPHVGENPFGLVCFRIQIVTPDIGVYVH